MTVDVAVISDMESRRFHYLLDLHLFTAEYSLDLEDCE